MRWQRSPVQPGATMPVTEVAVVATVYSCQDDAESKIACFVCVLRDCINRRYRVSPR